MAYRNSLDFLNVCFLLFFCIFYRVEGCPHSELKALLRFKASLNDSAEKLKSWEGNECCTWIGVHCDEIALGGHVTKLDLSGLQLSTVSDHIDSSLFDLKHLKHLDLSDNEFEGIMPQGLGSLTNLTYLSLSGTYFCGEVPPQLGNLSSLLYLNLGYWFKMDYDLEIPSLEWLSNLSSLKFLSMNNIQVNDIGWGSIMGSLSHLTHLELSACKLPGSTIPLSLLNLSSLAFLDLSSNAFVGIPAWMGNMSKLTSLDLSFNSLNGSTPDSLTQLLYLENLTSLDLSFNSLNGSIPDSLTRLRYLENLELNANSIVDAIPKTIGNLTSLKNLDLGYNQLTGSIPPSMGNLSALSILYLGGNQLSGGLPLSFSQLSSLIYLDASDNHLNGSIPSALPSSLWGLYLSGNNMMFGTITEALFQNSSKLRSLDLPGGFDIKISSTWIPPFQLNDINLSGCTIGGPIPSWISTQYGLRRLDLSGSKLVGDIPSWLRDISFLEVLNLENNNLDGEIPANLANLSFVSIFNMANNHFKGEIPKEFGNMKQLVSFRIGNNNLQGHLPQSLRNLSMLQVLDVGENNLTGNIPDWIADFSSLQVLVMRSNKFKGKLPPQIGQMPEIQILDLSSNLLSGGIPDTYFNFSAMGQEKQKASKLGENRTSDYGNNNYYVDGIDLAIKGLDLHYEYILSSLMCIDLSNNKLVGDLPPVIESLKGLMNLNVSKNNLSGPIPNGVGKLGQLESLDLSVNNFSGQIPFELGFLNYLAFLNLSYNSFSGKIPYQGGQMATFENSSYLGNPNLWGCPLERNCSLPRFRPAPPPSMDVEEETKEGFPWYEMSFGLSVGTGFSAVVMVLALHVRWRIECFRLMDNAIGYLFTKLLNW